MTDGEIIKYLTLLVVDQQKQIEKLKAQVQDVNSGVKGERQEKANETFGFGFG